MPLGTSHTVEGVVRRPERMRFVIALFEGGEWELELSGRLPRYVDQAVTIEGIRSGFNRLDVVRIKPHGEEWPERSWSDRWRRLLER
ncbi:hypothetical protein GRI75_08025 [Altererythrobacter soli]|uniref:Uncharacterized protein n=1 Tax=Croceibacterium soli TaxID=1739690 RepID=A0A6I4USH2_9SPHN|nr:DUF5818 domain-containing protein [Croceibacterium soli]MXP41588.1 hypothetical protein [Croceibacterium soli]